MKDQDEELSFLCEHSLEEVKMNNDIPRSKEDIQGISDMIVNNRAKMQHARLESAKMVDEVEDYMKKIKAAFLW